MERPSDRAPHRVHGAGQVRPGTPRHPSGRSVHDLSVVVGLVAAGTSLTGAVVVALAGAAGLAGRFPGEVEGARTAAGIAAGVAVLAHLWPRTTRWHQPVGLTVVLVLGAFCRWHQENPWSPLLWLALVHSVTCAVRLLAEGLPGGRRGRVRSTGVVLVAAAAVVGATLTGPFLGGRPEALGALPAGALPQDARADTRTVVAMAVVVVVAVLSTAVAAAALPGPPCLAGWTEHRLVPWLLLGTAWVSVPDVPLAVLLLVYPVLARRRRPARRDVIVSLPRPRRELAPR